MAYSVALGAFTFVQQVSAAPSPDRVSSYVDGAHQIQVRRAGSPKLLANGHWVTDAELRYPDGRTFSAGVDHTALVRIEPGAEGEVELRGGQLVRALMPSLGLWLVEASSEEDGADLAERLSAPDARERGIVSAAPNLYLRTRRLADPFVPDDPRFEGQWYFENLGMPEAWGLSLGEASTTVIVVDTGCDLAHPDLVSKMDAGLDVVDGDDDPSPSLTDSGPAHGTACAGIIAADTDNGVGIAGACPECRLRCVRMLSDEPTPISVNVEAFQFALDVDAAVVSNSWGFVEAIPVPAALGAAITNVATTGRGGLGAVVLFAAGNDDREVGTEELQAVEGVVCVGAINNFDDATPFTNSGAPLDVVAPTGTLTTDISGAAGDDPTDYTSLFGGTSSACPVAAGVAALLVSAAPEMTGAEIGQLLIDTARPAPYAVPDANGHDPIYGYGIIDPPTALKVALGLPLEEGGGGAGGGPSAGGGGNGAADGADEDGCGCKAVGSAEPPTAAWWWALAGLALTLVQRRRR